MSNAPSIYWPADSDAHPADLATTNLVAMIGALVERCEAESPGRGREIVTEAVRTASRGLVGEPSGD